MTESLRFCGRTYYIERLVYLIEGYSYLLGFVKTHDMWIYHPKLVVGH